jgi:autotransporter-associated beta strand protein/T5SS/PEP-CTERM-associated repeat protein
MRFKNAFAAAIAVAVSVVVFSAAFQPAEAATTTYTGTFSTPATINAGDTALLNNGATISGTGVITTNGTLQVNQTGTTLLSYTQNFIAGTGTFSLTNTGTVSLFGYPFVPLDLTTSVSAGELQVQYGIRIGETGTGTLNVSGGRVDAFGNGSGSFWLGSGVGSVGTAMVSSGTLDAGVGVIGDSGTGTLTVNGGAVNMGLTVIGNSAGGVGSVIVSSGTFYTYSLTVGNEGTGTLTINNGGLVSVDGDLTTSVTAGTASIVNINAGGTLKMNGDWYDFYPAPTLRTNLVNNGTLIFDNNPSNGNVMFAAGTISGTGSVTKQGDGTWVVGGSNSYTGPTNVNAGVLLVEGLLGNTAVTVNAGGLLAGSGTILGNVTVASSGTIAPFNAYYTQPQALTVGSLSLSTNSYAVLNIYSGTTPLANEYDQLVGSGTAAALTYGGNLDLLLTGSYADGTTWNLFSNFLTKNGDLADVVVTAPGDEYDGLTFTNAGGVWTSTMTANNQYLEFTQSTGNLVVVPEPSTIAMTLAGLACGGWQVARRRRRLRQAASLSA